MVLILLAIILARELYPYTSFFSPQAVDGYEVSEVATGLGGPTCLVWKNESAVYICDRDAGRIILYDITSTSSVVVLSGLDRPHGFAIDEQRAFVSEAGTLSMFELEHPSVLTNQTVLVTGIESGNHQTNAVTVLENGSLIWHSGSTCNVCDEDDERNGALLWVNASTGEHGILARGVRNSFDGVWVEGHGYFFTDNGRDWEGDHPREELNFLISGGDYGWPRDDPDHPIPEGSIAPIGTWTPHTSVNGIDVRPSNSSIPGLPSDQGFTLYATVYGSWNTILPQGHEIIRIDVRFDDSRSTYTTEVRQFVSDAGTPLPLAFNPNGDLYYATFGNGGALYKVS